VVKKLLPGESFPHLNPAVLLKALFDGVGGPIKLSDLVQVVAVLQEVKDVPLESLTPAEERGGDGRKVDPPAPGLNLEEKVVARDCLQQLWTEISQLPPRQATALLLNL